MIYYPLTVLMAAGVREFCIIATPLDLPQFEQLLGDGQHWGISIEYRTQPRPEGIAQAFLIAESFIGTDSVALMLGDNIFFGGDAFPRAMAEFRDGATLFACRVTNPQEYGVVEFDKNGKAISIEEKPAKPRSHYAVPGLYLYDNRVVEFAKSLSPSVRGELEITDVNRAYLDVGELYVRRLSRGFVWFDAGTSSSRQEASAYIETIERRQGMKLGCPEEAALERGLLSLEQFLGVVAKMPTCEYRRYLENIVVEMQRVRQEKK